MSRQQIQATTVVPEHEETTVSWTVTCDKCGRMFPRWHDETNELHIALDPDECVSYVHRRDYCGECCGPIWAAVCKLIGADPDSEENTGFDDD